MEHIHDTHAHSHNAVHNHTHTHVHNEDHAHANNPTNLKETKALLSYMIHHNEHHAEELADLLDSLPKNAKKN